MRRIVVPVLSVLLAVPVIALAQGSSPRPQTTGTAKAPMKSAQASEAPKALTLVGTLEHTTPKSGTVLVDVPTQKGILKVGATTTPATVIKAGGKTTNLDALQPDSKVRITVHRTASGDQLVSLNELGSMKG